MGWGPLCLEVPGRRWTLDPHVNTSLLQARRTVGSCVPTCTPVCLAS